jgi:hypothetical protein
MPGASASFSGATGCRDLQLLLHVPELHDAVGAPREDTVAGLHTVFSALRALRRAFYCPAHALHRLVARLRAHLGDHLLVLHRRHLPIRTNAQASARLREGRAASPWRARAGPHAAPRTVSDLEEPCVIACDDAHLRHVQLFVVNG